jgi:chromosome segregation ATPase
LEEKHETTEREISEVTLKRLHTLGNQRFGSFPFSEHFERWLNNVAAILAEFESYPNISLDDQFIMERSNALSNIQLQLEDRRHKEACVDQEMRNLSDARNRLKQINTEYSTSIKSIKDRKNSEIKRLYSIINRLEKEQNKIIRTKTGVLRGISKKEKEQREIEIAQKLNENQRELELVMLNFNAEQSVLREEFERKREPPLEQIKFFKKKIAELDDDGSLEERWFACEALIDAVNTFLQRKALQSHE